MILAEGGRRVAIRDDEPSAVYAARRVVCREVSFVAAPGQRVRVVVELSRALGGMTMRALIGAGFTPDPTVAATVFEVGVGEPIGLGKPAECVSELGSPLLAGLPADFGEAVLDGLRAASAFAPLPAGRMRVDRAGFDQVGSSEVAFRLAADLLHTVITALLRAEDPLNAARTAMDAW